MKPVTARKALRDVLLARRNLAAAFERIRKDGTGREVNAAIKTAGLDCAVVIKQLCNIVPNGTITMCNDEERKNIFGIDNTPFPERRHETNVRNS